MKTRLMSWKDWKIDDPARVISEIRSKVGKGDMTTQLLVLDACTTVYPEIGSYLYESIVHRKSYDRMLVYMSKADFYAYRRKAVALYVKVYTNKQRRRDKIVK